MTGGAADEAVRRAVELATVFHPVVTEAGEFTAVDPAEVPDGPRRLLDHSSHMTVAMERFHGGPVSLEVIASRADDGDGRYAREILLRRGDGTVVQYGIVRLDLRGLAPATAAAIRRESAPLGRILLEAGVLCDVHHVHLLRMRVGPRLRKVLPGSAETFGRVARIDVGGVAVVELLEVVAPGTAG